MKTKRKVRRRTTLLQKNPAGGYKIHQKNTRDKIDTINIIANNIPNNLQIQNRSLISRIKK